jgi:hypothetical protein
MIKHLSKLSISMLFAATAAGASAADPTPDPRLGSKPPEAGSAVGSSSLPRLRDPREANRNVRGEPEFGNRRNENRSGGYRWNRSRR